ncbi:MAG: serine/threonine-protein kinase, partial [Isosphaeraceae bacterium]
HADDEDLGFLEPSATPGCLGRFGPYEVTERLGRGGMGIVLKAIDPALNRPVAIKVLAPQLATVATARRRFHREAKAAASVIHEHVVTIHAVDEANGLPYLVMPYVPGKSLQDRIDDTGPLELKEILRIGMQAAAGLAAAHAQGLVHRDVKPANILLENGVERVKLTDFGLARAADDASLTQSGMLAGTPQYMAPEQARGETVDHRADLFSLGSVLYAMCTGRSPFRAESTIAVLKRVCEAAPRPIREINPEVPNWLTGLIAQLHAKDPADRVQTAAEVAERLGQRLAQLQAGIDLPDDPDLPPVKPVPVRRPSRQKRVLALAATPLVLLLGSLGVGEATGLTNVSDLAATVLRIPRRDGTLVIEVRDPEVSVEIDGDVVAIQGTGIKEVRLRPGTHQVKATRDGKPVYKGAATISRGDRQVVTFGFVAVEPARIAEVETSPRKVRTSSDLVEVEIRQRVTQFKFRGKTYQIPDQFVLNQGKGYLHPRNNLDYKLVVRNKTAEPLDACIAYSLPGQRPTVKTLSLQGNETNDTVVGTVYPLDLPDDKSKDLTVTSTEGNPDGPPLCPPLKVEFRKVHPREFITAMDGINGPVFFVCVTHEAGSDPVPLPAEVRVKVEPANAFRQLKPAVGFIDRGAMRVFPFQILPGQQPARIKWTVDAEGVSRVVEGTFHLK